MTHDDIIRIARDAGSIDSEEVIETVYAAFAAAEREACAKFIEDGYARQFESPWREDLAAVIRARGNA